MMKRSASAIGRQNKQRGNAFEREVAEKLTKAFHESDIVFSRTPRSGAYGNTDTRQAGDIIPTIPDLRQPMKRRFYDFRVLGQTIAIEAKNRGQLPIHEFFTKLKSEIPSDAVPIVIFRKTGTSQILVSMTIEDWAYWLQQLHDLRETIN
jgi:hypothetical protein